MNNTITIFKSYNRHKPIPLDVTSIFTSIDAAKDYVDKGTIAYPGQIIAIVYNIELKVELYYVTFDKPTEPLTGIDLPRKLKLEKLNISNISNGTNTFGINYKGKVDNIEFIDKTKYQIGDIVYSINDSKYYILNDNLAWDEFSMLLSYASEKTDGIITSEEYISLINKTNGPALYYNDNSVINNPVKSNKWINIKISDRDTENNMTIPSVNSVFDIVHSINDAPTIELVPITNLNNITTESIIPKFKIIYNPKAELIFDKMEIYKNKSLIQILELGNFNVLDNHLLEYEFIDNETYGSIGNPIEYSVTALYKENNSITEIITFKFYDPIIYGFNGDNDETNTIIPADGNDIKIQLPENNLIDKINGVYFEIPNQLIIDKVFYSSQPGINILSLFKIKNIFGTNRTMYVYALNGSTFNYSSYFLITFKKTSL